MQPALSLDRSSFCLPLIYAEGAPQIFCCAFGPRQCQDHFLFIFRSFFVLLLLLLRIVQLRLFSPFCHCCDFFFLLPPYIFSLSSLQYYSFCFFAFASSVLSHTLACHSPPPHRHLLSSFEFFLSFGFVCLPVSPTSLLLSLYSTDDFLSFFLSFHFVVLFIYPFALVAFFLAVLFIAAFFQRMKRFHLFSSSSYFGRAQ